MHVIADNNFHCLPQLLQVAKGELRIPNFPPRNRELHGKRFGQHEPGQTRFPPRDRPTPATPSDEEIEEDGRPLPSISTTHQPPVTLDRGTASAAVLNPQLPPIPTLPPGSGRAEHVSFLERFNRRGQKKRNRDKKGNKNKGEGQQGRKPRVKSDLQIQQISRWSRKGQQSRRAKQGRRTLDTPSNVVFVTTPGPLQFSTVANFIPPEDESFNAIDNADQVASATTAVPIVTSSPALPIVASTTRRPRSFGRPGRDFGKRPNVLRRPQHVRDAIFATPSPFVSGAPDDSPVATTTPVPPVEEVAEEETSVLDDDDDEPSVRPDGRRPRVKANIKARNSNNRWRQGQRGRKSKAPLRVGLPGTSQEEREAKAINLDEADAVEESNDVINPDDVEPRVRPDGQKPRVKSDILRRQGGGRRRGHRKNQFRHSKKVKKHREEDYSAKEEDTPAPFAPTPSPPQPTAGAESRVTPEFLLFGSSQVLNTRAIETATEAASAAPPEADVDHATV